MEIKMSKSKELVQAGQTALAVSQRRGFETESGREDLIIPRTKLLQALSPEVVDGDMKAGFIINSLTKEILPAEFIPVFVFKEYLRFNPTYATKPGYDSAF